MSSITSYSLAEFNQDAPLHLTRLRETGEPEMLTIDGEPKVVVQDAEAYQKLLNELDYRTTVEGIRRGLASFERGEGRPVQEFFAELAAEAGVRAPTK
ncbi:MAG: hypothetical protein WD851_18030 [Pirellulales bacterium]